jgi:hypothetical protein
MKLISHRGNIDGLLPGLENTCPYIQRAINSGYDVEVDVRLIGDKLFLGHDHPDHEVSFGWLIDRKDYLWVHAKNFGALSHLIDQNLRVFYHQQEAHTIINNCNLIWSHDLSEANEKSIIPLLSQEDIANYYQDNGSDVAGICSDFISSVLAVFNR